MPPRVSKMAADIWRPVLLDRADPAMQDRFFKFQARLKPGVTIAQADAEFRHRGPARREVVSAKLSRSLYRPRHRLRGQHRPGLQDDALYDDRGRRPAPVNRVRERREHAAQPRDGTPAGNRAAPRARREPRTDRAPAARREPRPGAARRAGWLWRRRGRRQRPRGGDARVHHSAGVVDSPRHERARVHPPHRRDHGNRLRSGPGASDREEGI